MKSVAAAAITEDYVFSFGKKLKGKPLENAQAYLADKYVKADGNWICFIGGETKKGDFEVHHVRSKTDHRAGNLRPACNSHNAGHHDVSQGMGMPSSLSLSAYLADTTKQIEINQGLFPAYVKWLENATAAEGKVLLDWAIYVAARELRERLGYGHPKTLKDYLKTLVAGKDSPYFVDGGYLCCRGRFEDTRRRKMPEGGE